MSLREVLTRATASNIAALIVITGGLVYGLAYGDSEVVKALAMFGAGYLFGQRARG